MKKEFEISRYKDITTQRKYERLVREGVFDQMKKALKRFEKNSY
ncbi:MAG: hypothetical protein QXO57_03985 [Candidatus Aenigmatarchaeota archaeon]